MDQPVSRWQISIGVWGNDRVFPGIPDLAWVPGRPWRRWPSSGAPLSEGHRSRTSWPPPSPKLCWARQCWKHSGEGRISVNLHIGLWFESSKRLQQEARVENMLKFLLMYPPAPSVYPVGTLWIFIYHAFHKALNSLCKADFITWEWWVTNFGNIGN